MELTVRPTLGLVDHARVQAYGWQLTADLHGCALDRISSPEVVLEFCRRLMPKIQMRPFGEPWVRRFGKPSSPACGLTLIQPIETSSLVVHFSDELRSLYLDLFSCKRFSPNDVVVFTSEFFGASGSRWSFSERY